MDKNYKNFINDHLLDYIYFTRFKKYYFIIYNYPHGSLALVIHTNNDIEHKSFTDVAIDERTESKATESKFKTEVEENSPLTN